MPFWHEPMSRLGGPGRVAPFLSDSGRVRRSLSHLRSGAGGLGPLFWARFALLVAFERSNQEYLAPRRQKRDQKACPWGDTSPVYLPQQHAR